ncbi:chemotaxis protein CheW [Roseomonas sp. GCM10028921]
MRKAATGPESLGTLGEARAARLMEERARRLAARGAAAPAVTAAPVLLVALGGETFGLPLDGVAEVLPAEPPCPLPGSLPAVLGLRARAGRVHTLLDLAALLGLISSATGAHDVLLRPVPGFPAGRRLALRVGRALSAASPLPLPPERAPTRPDGAVAFHAALAAPTPTSSPAASGAVALAASGLAAPAAPDAAEGSRVAVLDLARLLRPLATPSPPFAHGA